MRQSLLDFGLGIGRTQGGATPAVLTLVSDDLELDPPVYSFDSTKAGTLRWDFHSSATPPDAGAGDIATGTQAAVAGQNDIELDLSAYEGQTGYLHFRIGASNILTSQVITVPTSYADYAVITASNTSNTGGATRADTGLSPLEFGYFGGLTVTSDSGVSFGTAIYPVSGLPSATSGVPLTLSFLVKAGTSGNARIEFNLTGNGRSRITGVLGSLATSESVAGTISGITQTDLGSGNWRIDFTVTPVASATYSVNVGPFSSTVGHTIIWLGYRLLP